MSKFLHDNDEDNDDAKPIAILCVCVFFSENCRAKNDWTGTRARQRPISIQRKL